MQHVAEGGGGEGRHPADVAFPTCTPGPARTLGGGADAQVGGRVGEHAVAQHAQLAPHLVARLHKPAGALHAAQQGCGLARAQPAAAWTAGARVCSWCTACLPSPTAGVQLVWYMAGWAKQVLPWVNKCLHRKRPPHEALAASRRAPHPGANCSEADCQVEETTAFRSTPTWEVAVTSTRSTKAIRSSSET